MELLREHFYDVDLFAPMKRIHAEGAIAMRDNKADRIGAYVNVKGIAADLTGYSVKGYFVRSSIETIELEGGIDGNLAYVDLVGSCYKYDGGYTLTIKLVKDDAEISLLIVTGRVLATSTDTLVLTEDMVSEKEMLEKLNAIGNLDDLETVNKTNLVEAINEANRNGGGTGSGGTQGPPGKDGVDGKDGADGYSPTVRLERVEGGVKITAQNKDEEPHSEIVNDGNAPDILVVSFGLNENGEYTADKTQSDVEQAMHEGKAVLLVDQMLGHTYMYAATELSESFKLYSVFTSVPYDNGEATITTVARLGEDGKVELTPKSADDPNKKLNKSGWAPNKVLTTDADGNVVAAEIEIQSPDSPDSPDTPVEEQPLYSASFTDLVASAHNPVTLNFGLTAGTKYDVYVNGEKYTVTCENLLINAMLVIGNKHIIQDSQTDTGEPFFIYEKTGTDAGKQYLLVGTSGDYEISIYKAKAGGGSASNSGGTSLSGKKILILGDSVNAGNGWEGGFVNLINEDFEGVTVNNAAVAGAQFAGGDIYGELTLAFQSGFAPDYIVFDGGGNDLLLEAAEGTFDIETYSAGGYGAEFDKNTIAGAFEHLATNMQKFFPNAKIIFFNLYKMHPEATEVTYAKQRQVWNLLRDLCEKYSIKHVDLWREGNFTPNSEEQWDMYMFDWVHINEAGYRRFWPLIKRALLEV